MNCNESVVIISSVRYMIGRSSYGVGCVIDHVKSKKNELTQSNKEVIIRDINEHLDKWPETTYKDKWLELCEFLKD